MTIPLPYPTHCVEYFRIQDAWHRAYQEEVRQIPEVRDWSIANALQADLSAHIKNCEQCRAVINEQLAQLKHESEEEVVEVEEFSL